MDGAQDLGGVGLAVGTEGLERHDAGRGSHEVDRARHHGPVPEGGQLQLVVEDRENYRTVLQSNWRDNWQPIVNAEANRRITDVFPSYKQTNYIAQFNAYQTQYGADTTTWPAEAQTFKAEYDRGWKYVSDVRAASNAMTGMPQDPTADEHWPPVITPIA